MVEPSFDVASLKVTESSFTVTSFACFKNSFFRSVLSCSLRISSSSGRGFVSVLVVSSESGGFGVFSQDANAKTAKQHRQAEHNG